MTHPSNLAPEDAQFRLLCDPCVLIPTTPLTDTEIEALRTLNFIPAKNYFYKMTKNYFYRMMRNLTGITGEPHSTMKHVAHVLRHRSGPAFAMMRSGELGCSSTAVLFTTGEVVPIQECNTSVSLLFGGEAQLRSGLGLS